MLLRLGVLQRRPHLCLARRCFSAALPAEFWNSEDYIALEQGWNTDNERDKNGTALFISELKSFPVFSSDAKCVLHGKWLFKNRKNVDALETDQRGWNAIHLCAARSILSPTLDWFLQDGSIHPGMLTNLGETALHIAAESGNANGMELLINDGRVYLNQRDSFNQTALAKYAKHSEFNSTLFETLLKSKLEDPNSGTLNDAFLCAAQAGNARAVSRLMDERVDLESEEFFIKDNQSPLISSLVGNHTEVTRVLLSKSMVIRRSVNHCDSFGMTALMYAVMMNDTGIVRLLIDNGSDPTLRNQDGLTAKELAKKNHKWNSLELLDSLLVY